MINKNFLFEKETDLQFYNPGSNPDLILLHKVKINDEFNADYFRNYLAGVFAKLNEENITNVHIIIPDYSFIYLIKNFHLEL